MSAKYYAKSTSRKIVTKTNFLSSLLKLKKNRSGTKSITLVFIILLLTGLFLTLLVAELLPPGRSEVFIGMDIGYGDEQTAIRLVDEAADYVNLIV